MTFHCLTELKLKIEETDLVAKLAEVMLQGGEIGAVLGELNDSSPRRSAANTMTRAALVLLTGYFEGFLKKLIEEFVGELNDLKLPLNRAGDELLLSVVQHSITENRNKALPKILNLKDCISRDTHFPFLQEAIGKTKGNPSVDIVESLFQNIGIPEIIDKLSAKDFQLETTYTTVSQSQQLNNLIGLAVNGDLILHQKIIDIIDGKWIPKKQRRDVGYVGIIQELLKKRNRIAHGENWEEQVTPREVMDFNRDVLRLCTGIAEHLSRELEFYKRAPEAVG
ncbi:hypothetical protein C9383_15950 [Pseudomonas palleroniana]|uniref:RiboL-PSP-HEPN domain-containing protein n=1 Tax=Pseudomonas palleroniana TaxID=191390 RepID=A0A1H5LMW7_9PSED|nr:MAE_28990/MAE_18760 family HEPN-like nuclease [Pseudomonas palleroniana]KAB0566606.1 hypothetical protein F7R03_13595 [Pseudomonas palleroniana]PTC25592.1 hypothetical protein C9383_15950 [Pseudomonas palleroniana]SEE78344.1 hypothetical protein SAMN04490198_2833 [Pseudomonas palleroniana]